MPRRKTQKSLDLVQASIEILATIQPASVRAVCYQLFTRGLIGSMAKANTNRVSTQLVWAREAGHLDWDWIVDETREPEYAKTWSNPGSLLRATVRQYRKDRWGLQPQRVEVWSEKGTVRGTLRPVLDEYGVTFRVMHGYGSATALHQAAAESRRLKRPFIVLYCGDWDPSGMHMSEVDLPSRLAEYGANIELRRVALDHLDTTYGELPGFDVADKHLDARCAWFREKYGQGCWELDALSPRQLRERVAEAIANEIDMAIWKQAELAETAEHESLVKILDAWNTRSA